jgi:hypothetical protein
VPRHTCVAAVGLPCCCGMIWLRSVRLSTCQRCARLGRLVITAANRDVCHPCGCLRPFPGLNVCSCEKRLTCSSLLTLCCLQDNADGMRTQLEAQQKAVDQLIANTR